jgi:hypothetical protein
MPKLELLSWKGCPSTQEALELCDRAAQQLGIELEVEKREINDYHLAQQEQFVGSPTFRVAGQDLFDTSGQHFGLSCRVYTKPGGKFGPLPDIEEFKTKLQSAIS